MALNMLLRCSRMGSEPLDLFDANRPLYSLPGADHEAATGRTPRGALVPVAGARQAPGPGSQHPARAWTAHFSPATHNPCPIRIAWAERKGGGSLIVPTKKRS